MDDSDSTRPLAPPPWLRPDIHAAMRRAYDREVAAGHDPAAAVAAACAVLLACVAGPEPSGSGEAPDAAVLASDAPLPGAAPRRIDEADVADLVAALAYALRYDVVRGRGFTGGRLRARPLGGRGAGVGAVTTPLAPPRTRPAALKRGRAGLAAIHGPNRTCKGEAAWT